MLELLIACIADDDTGASDVAGMLADQGMETMMLIGGALEAEALGRLSGHAQGLVVSIGTRQVQPHRAYERTRQALRALKKLHPRQIHLKYSSTFDSTPDGNIGPMLDAALDELDVTIIPALPALPVNGRTTYQGRHYLHQQLLAESPMRHHPLTPMTDSNLVRWLGLQTRRKVGLIPHPVVQKGAEAISTFCRQLQSDNVAMAIVDCISDEDLRSIAEGFATWPVTSGSSALPMMLPAFWRARRELPADCRLIPTAAHGGMLVIAGSCSEITRRQNEKFKQLGFPLLAVDPRLLLADASQISQLADQAAALLKAGQACLLSVSSEPKGVTEVQDWGASKGLSAMELGKAISCALGELAFSIMNRNCVAALILAGGETAGAICQKLQLQAFRVGRNISPGIPLCYSLDHRDLPVVLKAGSFGEADLYFQAIQAIRGGEFS